MDNDVDFSELDGWLGTLEELKLGLEKSEQSTTQTDSRVTATATAAAATTTTCHVNRTFLIDPQSPRHPLATPRRPTGHFNPIVATLPSPVESTAFRFEINQDGSHSVTNALSNDFIHPEKEVYNVTTCDSQNSVPSNGLGTKQISNTERVLKGEAAEYGLNSLLKDLEAVEERMRKLEQGNDTFTRRYSLASSPASNRPGETTPGVTKQNSTTPKTSEILQKSKKENGFISVQWVADMNRDPLNVSDSTSVDPNFNPSPPVWMGAGDACVTPSNSPQPVTPSTSLLQQTEAGRWCMNTSNPVGNRQNHHNGFTRLSNSNCPNSSTHSDTAGLQPTSTNIRQELILQKTFSCGEQQMEKLAVAAHMHQKNNGSAQQGQTGRHYLPPGAFTYHQLDPSQIRNPNSPLSTERIQPQSAPQSSLVGPSSAIRKTGSFNAPAVATVGQTLCANVESKEVDDDSSLSGISSWSPGTLSAKRELMKMNSVTNPGPISRLSSSLSPEGSLSDKSLPDHTDSDQVRQSPNCFIERPQIKKLVVRIFRPDKTTKAIMLDEQMTAGEVASVLIEKNFLTPTTALVVVEKVPGLKVERIFEEHEKVADCILAWPSGSQNMIFFEERDDHFGFIDNPKFWLMETSDDSQENSISRWIELMQNDVSQVGFSEWRDYLYIRMPRDKTWSRKFCVLRSSGLYIGKKNKNAFSSADLKRILALDDHLHLYTTTGGWTRAHAPTPHGFAFKPYSSQDFSSIDVYCFCATDEKAFKQWICRLRMAKFGKQLYKNYQIAQLRVQRLQAIRRGPCGGFYNMSGSASACIKRKSSFDITSSIASPIVLTSAESARSLNVCATVSPLVKKRPLPSRSCGNKR